MRNVWTHTRRCLRVLRGRLRHKRAAVALVLLLALGVGEPLICILHCEIWLPMALQSLMAGQHHHHHHPGMAHAQAEADAPVEAAVVLRPSAEAPPATCFMRPRSDTPSDGPLPMPPSPVHEMVAAAGVVLVLALGSGRHLLDPPRGPPRVPLPPPLRPPIPFAG
jgi:hypothetical protein